MLCRLRDITHVARRWMLKLQQRIRFPHFRDLHDPQPIHAGQCRRQQSKRTLGLRTPQHDGRVGRFRRANYKLPTKFNNCQPVEEL